MKTAAERGGGISRPSTAGAIVPKCPHCGGRVEPKSNGNGAVRDVCTSCGRSPDAPPAPAAAARAPRFEVAAGSACRVKDCPGTLDGSGHCACCAKRDAWAAEHMPMRACEVCGGMMRTRFNARSTAKPASRSRTRETCAPR
jgi:hypothetical protein